VLDEIDLSDAFLRGVAVVNLFAVDEQDHVSLLLNRARFPQIRHHRPLVLALLDRTVQLRQRNHGYLHFLGERLQSPGTFRNLGGAVLLRARHLHRSEERRVGKEWKKHCTAVASRIETDNASLESSL